MVETLFECPVAKKTVVISSSVQAVRAGFPPVTRFVRCSGQSSCGVEEPWSDGISYNWDICPVYRSWNP